MNNYLNHALHYCERGFSVIPIRPGEKKPLIKWEPYQTNRAGREQIQQWWKQFPNANIGIVTGEISDLFVVDIDTDEGQSNLLEYGFESIVNPTVKTPRGGQHIYFKYPKGHDITIGAGVIKGTDFRGNRGYVLAPPSVNGNGQPYTWEVNLENGFGADLPLLYIKKINNNIYGAVTTSEKQQNPELQSVTYFEQGRRDNDLFHIANCLVKGGAEKQAITDVLERIIFSWGEKPDKQWVDAKIKSAMDRADRKERNLAQEVSDFVAVTNGYFSVTSCYSVLQTVTKQDKTTIRVALNRLKDKGIIERHATQDGIYRRVEKDFEFINFDENEPDEVEYPIKLPLGLNDIAEVSQGNIILVAGEFNAGKTAFLLNVLKMNKGKLPIRYISSEMKKSEFKKRFASFVLPMSFWMQDEMTEYILKSFDFHTCIKPEALNIIDYMEFKDSDYTKGAEYLTQIHDKLTTGIAIVAIQKKEGQRMPRSGDMIVEKPRLAISLSKYETANDDPQGICSILKCKMPKLGKIDGKNLRFELQRQGSLFHVLNDWGYTRFK
ncbi:MAG: bifunctional DNA primase/polymerase [Smithella sp.]|jgi:Fe2+ or Zn2+ uptake regulation protein